MVDSVNIDEMALVFRHSMNNMIQVLFPVSAVCFHFWTAMIGFLEQGLYGGILSFLFPLVAECYWTLENIGHNSPYAALFFLHIVAGVWWWKVIPKKSY